MTDRRAFLKTFAAAVAAGAVLPSSVALAFGSGSKVDIAELQLGAGTLSRPSAWSRLLYELSHTTSVECEPTPAQVTLEGTDLFEHPFCVLVGNDAFELPSEEGLEQLARFLSYGGVLFCDDTSGAQDSPFDASVRRLARALFPTRPLAPLPPNHSLYRAFFLINKPVGRIDRFDGIEGVSVGNLTPFMHFRNDLSGALERDDTGRQNTVVGQLGGEAQRRQAVMLGVNLVMYTITSNYKSDQAHVAELLRQGRLR